MDDVTRRSRNQIEQYRRRSLNYIGDLAIAGEPKMRCGWDAGIRSRSKWPPRWTRRILYGFVFVMAPLLAIAQEGPAPPPQVAIGPPRFELDLGPSPSTEAIRVSNLGDHAIDIQVSVTNWDLDEGNQIRVIEPTEQSLDQWMIINPLRFTVPPRKTQNVRFSIRPRVAPEPGEHRAMIFLDQVLSEEGAQQGIRMRFQYGVAVYGQVGEPVRKGEVHGVDVRFDSGRLVGAFDISCTGNAHVRLDGQYGIWPEEAFPGKDVTGVIDEKDTPPEELLHFGQLPSLPVLPGYRRQLGFDLNMPLEPGVYIMDVNGVLAGTPIGLAFPFTVPKGLPSSGEAATGPQEEDRPIPSPTHSDDTPSP